MDKPVRKANRLPCFDYSSAGVYFITACTKNKECILSEIVGGGALDAPHVKLSAAGKIVEKYIGSSEKINGIHVDNYVIMPNHIHLLIRVESSGTSRAPSPTNQIIPHYMSTLKRFVNRDLGENIFQRSFHDHVVRGQADYLEIWEYIENNPLSWTEDCFYS